MRFAIAFVDTATSGAGATRVARIDRDHGDACPPCLVLDEGAQLMKGPTVQDRSLAAASSCPQANALEVFKSNPACGVFGGLYDLLADDVVHVRGEAALLAGEALETALGRAGLLLLEFGAEPPLAKAHTFDGLALMERAVAVRSDVGDAEVNAEKVVGDDLRLLVHVTSLKKEEVAVAEDKITLAVQAGEQFGLMLSADEGHLLATVERPDRDLAFVDLVGDKAVIEGECRQRPERALRALVEFVGVRDFRKDAHCAVSAKPERGAYVGVAEFVQGELPERSLPQSDIADVVARGVRGLKCTLERSVLIWRRLEFEACDQLHAAIVPSIGSFDKGRQEAGAIPHPR